MEDRADRRYRWRGMALRIPLFLLSLLCFVQAIRAAASLQKLFTAWLITFLLTVAAGVVLEFALPRGYRCPSCGRKLGKPKLIGEPDSEEFVHDCEACGIRWHTLTHPPA